MNRKNSRRRPRELTPFGQILTSLMQEREIGVREAARIAGVGPSTIVSWRGGALPEDYRAVKKLAFALGCTLGYLLTGEDDSRPPGAKTTMTEVFSEGEMMFDGYAKITILKLLPKFSTEDGK